MTGAALAPRNKADDAWSSPAFKCVHTATEMHAAPHATRVGRRRGKRRKSKCTNT